LQQVSLKPRLTQLAPQWPQLNWLVLRSKQAPLQRVWPVLQVKSQLPLLQKDVPLAGAVQTLPQAPQLFQVVFRSTQDWEHLVVPAGQSGVHWRLTHAWPSGHTL
jgi:hypothetical protein